MSVHFFPLTNTIMYFFKCVNKDIIIILCDLFEKFQKNHAANREGSFNNLSRTTNIFI